MKYLPFILTFILSNLFVMAQGQNSTPVNLRIAGGVGVINAYKTSYSGTNFQALVRIGEGNQSLVWSLSLGKGEHTGIIGWNSSDYERIKYFEVGMHRVLFETVPSRNWRSSLLLGLSVNSAKYDSYSRNCEPYFPWSSFGPREPKCDPEEEHFKKLHVGIPLTYLLDLKLGNKVAASLGCHAAYNTAQHGFSTSVTLGINLGRTW